MEKDHEEIILKALASAIVMGTIANPYLFSNEQIMWAIRQCEDEKRVCGDLIDTAIAISEEG